MDVNNDNNGPKAIILTVDAVRTRASTNEALVTFAIPLEQAALISTFMGKVGKQVGAAFADLDARGSDGGDDEDTQASGAEGGTPAEPAPGGETSHRGRLDADQITQGSCPAIIGGPYGEHAKALRMSGFFRRPIVWDAVGTDEEYQAWCRRQKCIVCGEQDWDEEKGEGRCEYAHLTFVVNGAGKGHKPKYSGVPMLARYHRQIQHQHGYTRLYREHLKLKKGYEQQVSLDQAKEWLQKCRIQHLEQWCWETLKSKLPNQESGGFGYVSWSQVPPGVLKEWTATAGISVNFLPGVYRES